MPLGLRFSSGYKYYDALPASALVNKGKMEQMLKSFNFNLSAEEAIKLKQTPVWEPNCPFIQTP